MQRRIGRQLLVTNAIRVSTQLILESGKEPFDATKPEWTRKLNKKESWTKLVLHGWKYFRGRFACNDIGGYFERKYCTILNIVLCNMYVWIRKVVWVVFFMGTIPKIHDIKEISLISYDIEGIFWWILIF